MVASAENVLKSTENNSKSCENNSKSCEKPLNVRHDTVFLHTYLTEVRMLAPHALKGQKLLAQGSALGIIAIGKAPCKGKSFVNFLVLKAFALTGRQVCERNNPGRCPGLRASAPSGRAAYVPSGRAADCLYTQGVALGYELLPFTFPFGR